MLLTHTTLLLCTAAAEPPSSAPNLARPPGVRCHSYGTVVCGRAKHLDVTDIAVFGSRA